MNPFEGMSQFKAVALARKMTRNSHRWPTTEDGRQIAYDVVLGALKDPNVHIATQIKAAQTMLLMERQNQVDQTVSLGIGQAQVQPQMVLLLPPNGSEVVVGDEPAEEADSMNAAAEGGQ